MCWETMGPAQVGRAVYQNPLPPAREAGRERADRLIQVRRAGKRSVFHVLCLANACRFCRIMNVKGKEEGTDQ